MEPFVPLVKAIIISSMFSWGTSAVVITDDYMLRTDNQIQAYGKATKEVYTLFDLNTGDIYQVDEAMTSRQKVNLTSLPKQEKEDAVELGVRISKEKLEGYPCKVEEKDLKRNFNPVDLSTYPYKQISYFAKIDFLDKILDTPEKREFAGFVDPLYAPYYYLLSRYIQYEGVDNSDNKVLTIVEEGEVELKLIEEIVALPTVK